MFGLHLRQTRGHGEGFGRIQGRQALEAQRRVDLDNLGNLNYKQGLFDDAILEFDQLGAAQPLPTLSPAKLGNLYMKAGREGKSLDPWEKSLALDPN